MERFFDLFTNVADIESAYEAPGALDGAEVLFASYENEDYSGSSFVLFRKGGTLYEVHGSHCSCYGLEGQWEPETTTLEALRHRTAASGHYLSGNDKAFAAVLHALALEADGGAGL